MFRVRCSGDENKAWISEENHKTVCHSIGESPKSLFDTFGKNEVRYCELLCKANKDVTQTRARAHTNHIIPIQFITAGILVRFNNNLNENKAEIRKSVLGLILKHHKKVFDK